MNEARKMQVVNEITALAARFAGTNQLEPQMSDAILTYLAEQDRDTRHACANAVLDIERGTDDLIDSGAAHDVCMNARAI